MNIHGERKALSEIVFGKWDTDGSGFIDAEELTEMVYDQGYFLTKEEVEAAVVLLDKNGSGKIEYAEFKEWWAKEDRFQFLQIGEEKLKVIQQLTEYFKYFDKDKTGSLDEKEFQEMYAHCITQGYALKEFA